MDSFTSLATTTYTATVGFSPQQMIDFATSSVIRTYLGTGLSMIRESVDWTSWVIVVVVVMFSFVFLRFATRF